MAKNCVTGINCILFSVFISTCLCYIMITVIVGISVRTKVGKVKVQAQQDSLFQNKPEGDCPAIYIRPRPLL